MRRRSASLELTLWTAVVMTAILGGYAWFSLRLQRSWMLEEVRRGLLLASDTLNNGLRYGMQENRPEEILASIQRVARETHIHRIRIIGHGGQHILSTSGEEKGERLNPGSPGCIICHSSAGTVTPASALGASALTVLDGNTLRAFKPVPSEPGCFTGGCHAQDVRCGVLGLIELSLDLDVVEESMARRERQLGALALAASIIGGCALWFALSRRFRKPLRELLAGIRRISAGDLEYRIPLRRRDELGEVAESFNSMGGQLAAAQRGLIQSERLISMGKLAAGVAHEINNPLTGILSYGEALLEDTDPTDPRHKGCEIVVRESLRCREIVRKLLDFARQKPSERANVRPEDLIQRSIDVIVRTADFRNIRVEQSVEEDLPQLHVDPVQIQQVLLNLLVNAQQAMPQGGTISVQAARSDGGRRVVFAVKDQGIGIPEEIRTRVFEPFFTTKEGKSSGLGLAVCLGIVQQHGGSIEVESGVGKGTTFRVSLPVAEAPGNSAD
ncbi:MAG: ATP-binding protein [Acidobacteriota bacterium]